MDFKADLLPEIVATLGALLVGLIGWGIRALTKNVLQPWRNKEDLSLVERLASQATERLVVEINQSIDHLSATSQDLIRAARRPESPGGTDMTDEEWAEYRDAIWDETRAGLGQGWIDRLKDVVLGDQTLPPGAADMQIDAFGKKQIDAIFAERVDRAVSMGLRPAPAAKPTSVTRHPIVAFEKPEMPDPQTPSAQA